MSKREVSMFAAQGVDVDAPRAKRHRGPAAAPGSPAKEEVHSPNGVDVKAEGTDIALAKEDGEVVKEKGLKLWHVVKDAVNKEGRSLSYDFLRLPSKRQYPDYYEQIKHPVSLDEIKHQLDSGSFSSFEDVKQEFETCFRNAKRYNLRDSQIWKDAKHLHRLAQKEAAKLSGSRTGEGEEDVAGSDGEGEVKKKKAPNMSRLLKYRLQKLIEKSDDSGRVRSTEFMELPSKKAWPIYYKTIKKPQCLENIFKRLKRKEYHTSLDFANDVELIFSNALEFNQEHTEIWEDAIVLRDYFRQLMSDLPPPYSIPAYAPNDHSTKIKFKMPAAHITAPTPANSHVNATLSPSGPTINSPGTLLLRIPALGTNTPTQPSKSLAPVPSNSPTVPPQIPPAPTTPIPTPQPLPSQTLAHAPTPPRPYVAPTPPTQPLIQPTPYTQPQYTTAYAPHYPGTVFPQARLPKTATAAAAAQTSIHPNTSSTTIHHATPQRPHVQTQMQPPPSTPRPPTTASGPSTPVLPPNTHPLRCVSLRTRPNGRRLELDHRDGVKTWAVRLASHESSVHVGGVKFLVQADEVEESSDEEDVQMMEAGLAEAEEEEEEEEDVGEDSKDKGKDMATEENSKRGRGRPRKNPLNAASASPKPSKGKEPAVAKVTTPHIEVQVRLNGVVKISGEGKEEWDVDLPVGSNVLEVGEKGGVVWRVYLERLAW